MRRHWVVGTAGHVDHGKTSLVAALTGTDCDRLPEEKARGITTDLGFAEWSFGDGESASVIDVPGHERFVKTMVAGAAGIDLVLLVVASDDGVMPQTREHLAISALLGVRAGVVALTKADVADEEQRAAVVREVRAATADTFLKDAEIVACSARSGLGLADVTRAVRRALPVATLTLADGPAFLPVDRSFHRPGAGLVVTGTLLRGHLTAGEEVDLIGVGNAERGAPREGSCASRPPQSCPARSRTDAPRRQPAR